VVSVLVIGLAALIIAGVERDLPFFRDFLRPSLPPSVMVGARVISDVEIDARIATTRFELDLEKTSAPSSQGQSESMVIELPEGSVVRDVGIRMGQTEIRGTARKLNDGSERRDALVLDSVRWSLIGVDHVLIEYDPVAPQFTLWLNISSFLMARDQSFAGSMALPRLLGPLPEAPEVRLAFQEVTGNQPSPDFSIPRSPEQIIAGQSRRVGFNRQLTLAELYEGLKFPITFDSTVNLIWTPIAVGPGSAPESEPVLVVRIGEVVPKTSLNLAKIIPATVASGSNLSSPSSPDSSSVLGKIEEKIREMAAGSAVIVGKDLRPTDRCEEARSIAEAWQWAAAQVDSLVVWIPGASIKRCEEDELAAIMTPLAAEMKRAGGTPKIAVITDYSPATALIDFAPYIGSSATLTRAGHRRYQTEYATFEKGSLPAGPEIVTASENLKVLWEFSVVNSAATAGTEAGFLTVSSPLAVARP